MADPFKEEQTSPLAVKDPLAGERRPADSYHNVQEGCHLQEMRMTPEDEHHTGGRIIVSDLNPMPRGVKHRELRRPLRTNERWPIPAHDWENISKERQAILSHVVRIEETDDGEVARSLARLAPREGSDAGYIPSRLRSIISCGAT
jgi:hypothetical protein